MLATDDCFSTYCIESRLPACGQYSDCAYSQDRDGLNGQTTRRYAIGSGARSV